MSSSSSSKRRAEEESDDAENVDFFKVSPPQLPSTDMNPSGLSPNLRDALFAFAICQFIEEHEEEYVARLKEAVAIQSVSAWPENRGEIVRMIEWARDWVVKLGGTAVIKANPIPEDFCGDEKVANPPILMGSFGNDPQKRTVCVYGHLDVQPAPDTQGEGWLTADAPGERV